MPQLSTRLALILEAQAHQFLPLPNAVMPLEYATDPATGTGVFFRNICSLAQEQDVTGSTFKVDLGRWVEALKWVRILLLLPLPTLPPSCPIPLPTKLIGTRDHEGTSGRLLIVAARHCGIVCHIL